MPDSRPPATVQSSLHHYWRTNLITMVSLLIVWGTVSLGCSVLFADFLNQFTLPGTGFPLGFWFAQQGSIMVFVVLVLVYCLIMNKLDARHHEELTRLGHRSTQKED